MNEPNLVLGAGGMGIGVLNAIQRKYKILSVLWTYNLEKRGINASLVTQVL